MRHFHEPIKVEHHILARSQEFKHLVLQADLLFVFSNEKGLYLGLGDESFALFVNSSENLTQFRIELHERC